MSEYQLKAVNKDGDSVGEWHDLNDLDRFFTDGDHVLIREKPESRGTGWYQKIDDATYYNLPINKFSFDPGEDYQKMHVEVAVL